MISTIPLHFRCDATKIPQTHEDKSFVPSKQNPANKYRLPGKSCELAGAVYGETDTATAGDWLAASVALPE
jgi:hypothetical protein